MTYILFSQHELKVFLFHPTIGFLAFSAQVFPRQNKSHISQPVFVSKLRDCVQCRRKNELYQEHKMSR